MGSKVIRVSAAGAGVYSNIPGNSGTLKRSSASFNDSIFGQNYESGMPTLLSWNVEAPAFFKGFAGYLATIKGPGTSTAEANAATTNIGTLLYQITAASKRVWDRSVAVVVKDNGSAVSAANIEYIDYLFGIVKFVTGYTVTGAITVSVNYFPLIDLGKARGYTLTQTAAVINTTDYPTARANGGFMTGDPGLRTVGLELRSVYDAAASFLDTLVGREELIIEINPDGAGQSICRGFYRMADDANAGDLGALEEETLNFALNVPEVAHIPFGWVHTNSTIPAGIKKCLDAWTGETKLDVQYLPDGTNGEEGQCFVTDISLSGELEGINEFTVSLQGDGELSAV